MVQVELHISNRKVINKDEFNAAFKNLKDGKHLVTIKDLRKRSIAQNSYYWGVMIPLVRHGLYEAGYDEVKTNDDAHEVLKHVHLKQRIVNKQTGDVIDIAGSSAALTTPEFNIYVEAICKWAAEFLGVVIPSPNNQLVALDNWIEKIYGQ
jgi:hypothetical protein